MSAFKDMVSADNAAVFLNVDEFADKRTVRYDGEDYVDIPIVLTGMKEKDRRQVVSDHAQGLYLVSGTLYCRKDDLGGRQPKKGVEISINNREGGGGFFRRYTVAASSCAEGMLRVELEAVTQ